LGIHGAKDWKGKSQLTETCCYDPGFRLCTLAIVLLGSCLLLTLSLVAMLCCDLLVWNYFACDA